MKSIFPFHTHCHTLTKHASCIKITAYNTSIGFYVSLYSFYVLQLEFNYSSQQTESLPAGQVGNQNVSEKDARHHVARWAKSQPYQQACITDDSSDFFDD